MPQFNNTDKLDMKGDWTFKVRNNFDPSFTFPSGHLNYDGHIRIVDAGAGKHGGKKFKGTFFDPPIAGLEMTGETVYLKRGVQLVQLLGVRKSEQYLWVLSGKHVPDDKKPKKVWILGASFDVGQSAPTGPGGQGTANVFEMVKLKT
jgi:hypothetical protein